MKNGLGTINSAIKEALFYKFLRQIKILLLNIDNNMPFLHLSFLLYFYKKTFIKLLLYFYFLYYYYQLHIDKAIKPRKTMH